jgi:hypothetical protein
MLHVIRQEIHVDDELLDEYLLRRTDEYATAAVAQHLGECTECRSRWTDLLDLRAVLAVSMGNLPKMDRRLPMQ